MEHDEHSEMGSMLNILNDPLLTILGVLLAGFLWLVFPMVGDATDGGPVSERQMTNQKDSLEIALDELRNNFNKAQDSSKFLARELMKMENEATSIKPGNPVNETTKKAPTYFLVQGNTITPETEDYFEYENIYVYGSYVRTEATKKRDGENIDQISKPTSDFAKIIAELIPDSQCVVFIVDSKGFDTFRAAREILRSGGIQSGWEPHVGDQSKLFFSTGGRDAHVEPPPP